MTASVYTSAQGNFYFDCEVTGVNPADSFHLPADKIEGINDGVTSVIRHRESGTDSTSLMPYAGITTAEKVTISGTGYWLGTDEKKLIEWRNQVKGKVSVNLGGMYRDITVIPKWLDEDGNSIDEAPPAGFQKMTLVNCLCVKYSQNPWDVGSSEIRSWTIEIEYADLEMTY